MTLAEDIAHFCRVTWDRGLVSAAGGNISARVDGTDTFLITPSGVALRDTVPEDMVTIDLDGRKLAGPERYKPSKESLMHTAISKHLRSRSSLDWRTSTRIESARVS